MKNKLLFFTLLLTGSTFAGREIESFNKDWRFARFGEMPDGSMRAEPENLPAVDAEDSDWRILNLPHDWGIEGPFRADLPNETGKLPWVGIGWYRKTFAVPASDQGRRIFIDFDGAMSHAKVWLNGEYVGEWPYGYSSFRLELTDRVKFGADNVIAVRLENPPESSRWYPGGGIYRNVRLVKTNPVHVDHWGVSVTTPEVSKKSATVMVETKIIGADENTRVQHEILEAGVCGTGAACTLEVPVPKFWDLESPDLYTLKTVITQNGKAVDTVQTIFGIRTIEFDADRGFLLNGNVTKLNGVCMHHDLGPLGAAVSRRAIERQLEILKSMGCNAIRTSHNPPAPELLDLCDRMGLVVQVEAFDCWAISKKTNDYSTLFAEWHEKDLVAMVNRDRNHPSVVMWSTGNEVREMGPGPAHNPALSQALTDILHREDPTRPVSNGCSYPDAGFSGFQDTVDVFGYNYKPHLYEKFRKENPGIPLYGSETASCISSRGEYFFPVVDEIDKGAGGFFQVSSYDLFAPHWATKPDAEFEAQDRYPSVFGEFVWTGFDYIGEPTPYNNDRTNLLNFTDPDERAAMEKVLAELGGEIPPRSSYFGIIDLCGFPKDRYYLYQSRWRPELPMVHILPHWNWPDRIGKLTPVHVYTSGDEAELFLNGKSLGRKRKGPFEYRLRWDDVLYQPGALKAVAYKSGSNWAEAEMKTTGPAARVELSADRRVIRADGEDLSFVTVKVTDENGLMVPGANNRVRFDLSGPGELVAVGNGNPVSHELFQAHERKAFNGMCLVVIRSREDVAGDIWLRAAADGLMCEELTIRSR